MKPPNHPLPALLVSCLMICASLQSSRACTIFVLTDTNRTLFANNEDWSNPKTRMWFIPAGAKNFAAVYVGFDDGWAQGGMNTEGLACDWVAGFNDVWQPDASLTNVWGNSSQQMLETCATVEEAIAFYRGHREPGFYRARILRRIVWHFGHH
jgi:penicillin V acylase-like amidase (Ntn superfamily)